MLGVTVERGKIVEWLKKEGDRVVKGEIIFIVEVEKATTEVESPASGILAKIILPAGIEVPILSLAAVITAPGEELPAKYATGEAVSHAKPAADTVTEVTPEPASPPASAPAAGAGFAMPAARKLAAEKGIDLSSVKGSGPDGVILLRDVEAASGAVRPGEAAPRVSTLARKLAEKEGVDLGKVEGTGVRGRIMRADVTAAMGKAAPREGFGTKIPMSSVRKVIARRMSESAFTAPHIYFFTEVWMDPLLRFRKEVVPDFEKHFGIKPSINDFLVKAVALNIVDFPMLNAQIKGEEIHIMPEINVGLAVAVAEGLVVPAIAHADRAGLVDIANQRADLIERARKGRLSLMEMERGTFTVSSLAQYDITHFTAILNPPQSGILSVGKTDEKLVLVDGQVRTKQVAVLGLSVDHRIIDGAVAADFLQNLKWKLERPAFTFLSL
ncbi:MAG: 2-oxo acid dehydrogenase subunit E2 [Desulfobacteraceae bacterium]|nr:MAG: 2-oxo acid dehydrogenase subunit E2 [Desulfobacteraceae bacterium]